MLELISLPHFINVEDPQIVTNRFTEMLELNKSPHLGARLQQKAMLFQLLAYYIEHSNLPDAKDMFKDEKLAGLMLYIEEHLPDTLTINELCGIMHFHPNYFIRYFKEATGLSPMEYISNLRIEHAKRMLQTEEMAIQDIAKAGGLQILVLLCSDFQTKNRLHAHRLSAGILLEAHISRSGNWTAASRGSPELPPARLLLLIFVFGAQGREAGKGLPPHRQ